MPLAEMVPGVLWTLDERAASAGFELGARMTIVRLHGGGLWVHSPLEPTLEVRQALAAIGPVRHIVAPARFHFTYAAAFAGAYPDARLYAVESTRGRFGRDRSVEVLGETPPAEWGGVFEQALIAGSRLYDEADFFHRESRTLILTDLLFNLPRESSLVTRLIGGVMGIVGAPAASPSFALTVRDRAVVRASLGRVMEWDFDRIVLSHGGCVPSGGRPLFARAFGRFLNPP